MRNISTLNGEILNGFIIKNVNSLHASLKKKNLCGVTIYN